MLSNIVSHPKTSMGGLLIGIVTVVPILEKVDWSHLNPGTVIGLLGALATALLGLLSRDPGGAPGGPSSGTVAKLGVVLGFLAVHARFFLMLAAVSGSFALAMLMTGCASPLWLTDATALTPVLSLAAVSIVSLIAGLTGNAAAAHVAAELATWGAKVQAGLQQLDDLVGWYKQSPNAKTLENISKVAAMVAGYLQEDLSQLGLPAETLSKMQEVIGIVLQQLQAWSSLLPLSALSHAMPGETLAVGVVTAPAAIKTFKAQFNAALVSTTGHAETDAAAGAAKRL